MPEKGEIMRAVQKGLSHLKVGKGESDKVWTEKVKTELCKIGRSFDYRVYARADEVHECERDGGEWLYDVTWIEYERGRDGLKWPATALIEAPLVAECEWGNFEQIVYDFEKLLLARARVRLMVFDSHRAGGSSKEVAERLAGKVREFNGSLAEDAWLLASWERSDAASPDGWWRFRYFMIEMNAAIPFSPPS